MTAAAAPPLDAARYAEALRRELIEGLGVGDLDSSEGDDGLPAGEDGSYSNLADAPGCGLQDLGQELEAFSDHEIIRDILDQGRMPREYARGIDDRLRAAELDSIQDYIAESDNLVALHGQISQCDGILEHMEQLLGKFQSDLGKVSDEIRALQVQSQVMSTRLRNRRAIETRLGGFIEAMAVPEDMVTGIMEAEVNEEYLEHLLALDRKLAFLASDGTARGSQARRDVEAVLEKLRIKAITKVREFLLARLYQLRKPKTNISIIQQNVLLKYKYFVRFVREHGEDVYQELRAEYASVVSRVLAAHFRTYLLAMEKMAAPVAGQGDVLGVLPEGAGGSGAMGQFGGSVMSAMSGAIGLFGKAQGRATSEHSFQLGVRAAVLSQVDQPAVVPHMAEVEGRKFPYEVIFRNVHKLLADTASSEFLFCLDFWEDEPLFRELLAPVVAVVEGDLSTQLQEQWDAVGVLLMIRINEEHRRLMKRRRVPCLDDYLDRVNLLLWPRFKVLWDLQHASIRFGAERQLFTGEVAAHPTVRRYAALTASVLQLMAQLDGDDDGAFKASAFQEMLDRMWAAVFDLLLRMSNMFKDRRQGIVFLILNYAHIGTAWREADSAAARRGGGSGSSRGGGGGDGAAGGAMAAAVGGGLGLYGAAALKECEDQLSNCVGLYVEDQLSQHFRDLVEFVKKAEQQQKRAATPEGQPIPFYGPRENAPVLRDFAVRWRNAIGAMHQEVSRQFLDEACARDVLQASMTQLLLYYTRMLELLKRQGPEGVGLAREAVNIPAIMYEIKSFRKA